MTNQTICLLNDSFPPIIDGVANTVLNYAEHLQAAGNTPIVITPAHPQANDLGYSYPILRYKSVNFPKREGYVAGLPFSPEVARRLADSEVSVIHSHCPIISTFMAREIRQIKNAPIVLTYHTKFDIDIANIMKNRQLQAASKKGLVANISACDEVWVVSKGAGDNLRGLGYEGDYIVMPNGVDLPHARIDDDFVSSTVAGYDLPKDIPVYLFVGRMMWYKGIRIIIDALAGLHRNNCDFRMIFIGDGDDRAEIEDYALESGIKDKCIFTGAIHDRDRLRAWYCRADLFLFPSTYDTNGLVVREAAACDLASVLIKGSCASEGVTDGQNGFLVEEDPESLFICLLELHNQMDKMHDAGEAAGRELYISWKTSVQNASERYQIVIDRYKSGGYTKHLTPIEGFMKVNGELMELLGKFSEFTKI